MHGIVNNTAPECLTSRFVRRYDLTSYNLRENEYKLAVPQPRTEVFLTAEVCYNLPQLTSPNSFKGNFIRDKNFD